MIRELVVRKRRAAASLVGIFRENWSPRTVTSEEGGSGQELENCWSSAACCSCEKKILRMKSIQFQAKSAGSYLCTSPTSLEEPEELPGPAREECPVPMNQVHVGSVNSQPTRIGLQIAKSDHGYDA